MAEKESIDLGKILIPNVDYLSWAHISSLTLTCLEKKVMTLNMYVAAELVSLLQVNRDIQYKLDEAINSLALAYGTEGHPFSNPENWPIVIAAVLTAPIEHYIDRLSVINNLGAINFMADALSNQALIASEQPSLWNQNM